MTSHAMPLPVRFLHVVRARRLTPRMARITLGGPDLADFRLEGPDQQVKLYFPKPGQNRPRLPGAEAGGGDPMSWYTELHALPEAERPWMRSYTIRAHHPADATIDIDFVLHGAAPHADRGPGADRAHHADAAGPATRWALGAQPGDVIGMFGPSAYFAKPLPLGVADWTLLAGDETALPALGTIAEALPEGAEAVAFIEVQDAAEEQHFTTRGDLTVHWLHRGRTPPGHADLLLDAVRGAALPQGSAHVWLAGEAGAVRGLRRHLVGERGIAKADIDFAGYWRLRLTQDDAPTPDDLADAQELLAQAQASQAQAQAQTQTQTQTPESAEGRR